MKKVFAIICVLAIALSLVACGDKNPLIGSWVCSDSEVIPDGATSIGFKFIDETDCKFSMIFYDGVESQSGTYTYDKNTFTITIDHEAVIFTYKIHGKTMEVDSEELPMTMTFTKK